MAKKKKKKGIGSIGVETVLQKSPKTIYNSNSGGGIASSLRSSSAEKSTNYQSSGGIGATGTSTVKETATQRAERERSNKMRNSALFSIAKTMSKNSASTYKATLPSIASRAVTRSKAQAPKTSVSSSIASRATSSAKAQAPKTKVSSSMLSRAKEQTKVQAPKSRVVNTIAKNALAPVSKYAESHMVTGGHGVGTYGFKTSVRQKALAPAKEIAEYTRKQQNKYVYTPNNDYRFDAKGNMLMKKDPISIEYGKKLRAGMPSKSTAIMSWRGNPSKEELKYRDKYGYTQKAREALDTRLNENMLEATYSPTTGEITPSKHGRALLAGHSDTWSLGNIEDTYRKQYGIDLDKETLDKIKAQRETANYTTGSMIAQAEQYAATRGLLGAFGLVGKAADAISDSNKVVSFLTNKGVKTGTAKAITALMEEMGIDQAASVPLNLVDAMKADGGANVIKRFGINQGLDVLFSGLSEIPALKRNWHFLNGNEMNEAANAMQEGTEKLSTKIGAKGHLDTAMDETGDVARQEAEYISREEKMRKFVQDVQDEAKATRTPNIEQYKNAERIVIDGDITTREAFDAAVAHGVPESDRYEWQIAFNEARRVGTSVDDSINYADIALEENAVRQFREQTPSERLALARDESNGLASARDDVSDRLNSAAAQRGDDVLLNAKRNAQQDNGLVGANDRLPAEERGTYGKDVTRKYTESIDADNGVDEAIAAYDRPLTELTQEEDELWDATYKQARLEYATYPDADERAVRAADAAVMQKREIDLANAVNRADEASRELRKFRNQQGQEPKAKKTPNVEQKPKVEPRPNNESVYDATYRLFKNWGNDDASHNSYRVLVDGYRNMSPNELVKERNALRRAVENSSIDPAEAADRTAVIDAIAREKEKLNVTGRKSANAEPKASKQKAKAESKQKGKAKTAEKAEEPKAETASKEEVFVSEEQVDKVFNDAIRKRSYRFETLRAYPRSGDMRIIIGDRAYDERGFRRLIREDLERTKAQVNEAINARAAKVGKQKASVEEPKAEPKAEAKAEEPKRNQVKGALDNEEPKAKAEAEDTRTWQEKAKADFYESSKNRAKDVKKGKIPSRESGEVVNAIKRLKETVDFSDMKDTLERGIKDGFYNRKIRHLDEEMDKAIKAIEEDPEREIDNILKYHPNGEKGADIPADAVPFVMKGYALCKWADQNGMKALKEDIAATMAKAQSAGGSVLRAGQVFTVMADSHTQRDIVADFVEKMQTKYAKRLGDHKLSVPEDLLKKLDDATTDAEKSKALDDISVHVWNQVPQSFFDAISGLRIVSMLANTTTMIRNMASNAAFLGVREADKVTNTVMESAAEKLNKIDKEHRTHSFYNPFSKENRKIKSYWDNDYGNNSNIIKGQSRWDESGGALNVDFRHEDARHYGVKAGGGKKGGLVGGVSSGIEAARKATTWIMDKGDEIFLRPAYSDAATQLMHARGWGIDDLTPARIQEIREYATDVAQKATYRDPSDAAMALAKWGHWQKGDGGLRLFRAIVVSGLQPFKKTPINIGKRSVEYSPLGFVKGVYDIGKAVHAGDSKAVNKAITELSHGTTGTGLVVAGYLLAQQGLVNAKLPSDDEGYLRKDLGEQDYALTLNGKSRSLQWAAPGAVPILAGATLYDQIRQRGWNSLVHPATLVSVLSESTNPLLEMSFMLSYMDIADVTDDVEGTAKILVGLEQIGLSYAAQFIPTILGKIANVVDPVRRDTSSQKTDPYEKAVDRFIKKSVINKIPNVGKKYGKEWGSASLPAYIDYKGDEQVTEKMSDRIVENFISPWYTKDIKDDPVAKEVIKVNKHQDENVIFKSSMDKGKHELKFDGKTINLDAHEMEDYKKVRGKANYNNVKKLMNSAEYKSMSWSEKGKAMKKEEDAATAEAKTEALLKKGLDEWLVRTDGMSGGKKESVDAAKDLGLKPKEYVNVVNDPTVDLDENGTLSQYEVYTYLEKTDYPTEVKDMFWRAFNKGWTSDKTNPYRGGKLPTPPDPDDVELKKAKKEAETLSKAKPRAEGSMAAKAFEKSVLKKATETASLLEDSGSGSSKGSSRRGRSGRRGGGGSGSSKRKQTASERKFANGTGKLSSVDLEKIYKQTQGKQTKLPTVDLIKIYEQAKIKPAKVPTTSLVKAYTQVQQASKTKTPTPMDIKVKGLTKSQKKAMLKVMLKKLDTKR